MTISTRQQGAFDNHPSLLKTQVESTSDAELDDIVFHTAGDHPRSKRHAKIKEALKLAHNAFKVPLPKKDPKFRGKTVSQLEHLPHSYSGNDFERDRETAVKGGKALNRMCGGTNDDLFR